MSPKKKTKTCSKCKGNGTVKAWTKDRHGKRISYDKTCDQCKGTGETTAT